MFGILYIKAVGWSDKIVMNIYNSSTSNARSNENWHCKIYCTQMQLLYLCTTYKIDYCHFPFKKI